MPRVVEECCEFENSRRIVEETTNGQYGTNVNHEFTTKKEAKNKNFGKESDYYDNDYEAPSNDHKSSEIDDYETQTISTSPNHSKKPLKMCSTFTSLCNENEICVDTVDSYNCTCNAGFLANNKTNACEDVDECTLSTHNCTEDKFCINTFGSFSCEAPKCAKGFEIVSNSIIDDDVECIDVDECLSDPCGDEKICRNTEGSYECLEIDVLRQHCEEGFEMVEDQCIDKNECKENVCERNDICTNLKGSYRCEKIECEKHYRRFLKR